MSIVNAKENNKDKKDNKHDKKESKKKKGTFNKLGEELKRKEMPVWLSLNKEKLEAKTIGEPSLDEVKPPAEISSIFEYYSR